jgi:hypothetical protein
MTAFSVVSWERAELLENDEVGRVSAAGAGPRARCGPYGADDLGVGRVVRVPLTKTAG